MKPTIEQLRAIFRIGGGRLHYDSSKTFGENDDRLELNMDGEFIGEYGIRELTDLNTWATNLCKERDD